jgi:uncharacterized lipoprotein YbaY
MGRFSRQRWTASWLVGLCVAPLLWAQEPAVRAGSGAQQAIEWKRFDYTCEGGAKLTAYLHADTVKILFNNHVYRMQQVVAASGTRYSDGRVVWWSKGNGGFLQHESPDGNGEMIVQNCQLNRPLQAGQAEITGTVSYLVRSALPPDAIIQVELQDVSRADAPATTMSEDRIPSGQHQVPIAFALKFNPSAIHPQHVYAVNARITVEGRLRFTNDRTYLVLTQGHPSHIEMILQPVDPTHP